MEVVMKKGLFFLIVALGLFLLPSLASADYGYPCYFRYLPSYSGTLGSDGYILVSFYSQPACSGSFVASKYICSTGATSNSCPSSSVFYNNGTGLGNLAILLQNAVLEGQKTYYSTTACNGGGSGCLGYINFYGN